MPFRRVLVHLKGYLGDAVMVTPLLDGLVNQAKLEVEVLTEPAVIELLKGTFPTAKFHVTRKIEKPSELLQQAKEIRAMGVDVSLVVNRSFRSALVSRFARVPTRYGHGTDGRGFLLTKSIPYSLTRYEPDSYLDLAKLAGIEIVPCHPRLAVDPKGVAETASRLQGASVGIQPGARHPWKRIPIPSLVCLVKALQADGHCIALLGGPEEKEAGEELMGELPNKPYDLIGAFSLQGSLAALSCLKLMVGGDTGLMHMGAAVGCPTVTVFGPTMASKWAHRYPPHEVVMAPGEHLEEVPPEQIVEAARRALGR